MRSPIVDLLADLGGALAGLKIDWYLFGAQAAILYGVSRLTADVDVTVRIPDNLPMTMVVQALERRGFRARVNDMAFMEQSRVLPFVHAGTGLPVDLVLAGPGIEDEFFARVKRQRLEDVEVPVADVADLIVMKVLAGRPKDIEDVVGILGIHAQAIDVARVRRLLGVLESALAQSDLLPAFDAAVASAVRRRP